MDSRQSMRSESLNRSDESDGENYGPKTPRRTPMACQFCRGRKMKCDGRPMCTNCSRRNIACSYVPVSAQSSQK